jgi:hypothetical protein
MGASHLITDIRLHTIPIYIQEHTQQHILEHTQEHTQEHIQEHTQGLILLVITIRL